MTKYRRVSRRIPTHPKLAVSILVRPKYFTKYFTVPAGGARMGGTGIVLSGHRKLLSRASSSSTRTCHVPTRRLRTQRPLSSLGLRSSLASSQNPHSVPTSPCSITIEITIGNGWRQTCKHASKRACKLMMVCQRMVDIGTLLHIIDRATFRERILEYVPG